jgi:Zn-finger nucleic acid-binding protein
LATDLICPKCQGLMRTYERSGVTVDQCADCRGIFLDRGELVGVFDAELGWQRGQPAPSDRDDERGRQQTIPNPFKDRDEDRRYSEGSQKRRKKSFFDELFD